MRPPEECQWKVLIPYDPREGMSLKAAADRARKSPSTIRGWCALYGLGRRVGGGVWIISKIALEMHLDGNRQALRAYHSGDRTSPAVRAYFERAGVPLPTAVA